MKRNKGISLIVLIITIIVIIIIAGAVILDLDNDNVMSKANEAKFKSNVGEYKSEFAITKSSKYLNDSKFKSSTLNAGAWNGLEANITGTVKEYIKSITVEDGAKFEIQGGKLVYIGSDDVEKNWITGVGISSTIGLGVNVIATVNTTVNGGLVSYSNPIIPKGFKAVNDGAVWPTDWDKGLVIEDSSGNQFVWVPVDGIKVPYTKWCTINVSYVNTTDDTLPAGITSETDQITKYGGFYIARYEAGNVAATLVSKKNVTVWNNINYTNSKLKAVSMYNTNEVKSGLVTGRQWDATVEWIKDSGKSFVNSGTWGNHLNSSTPANVVGFGSKQVAGFSEFWKAKNIYDLAGNEWEWTNEKNSTNFVNRGGTYAYDGSPLSIASRNSNLVSDVGFNLSFRVALYIL